MKYLIFGANGQLGSELRAQLNAWQSEGKNIHYTATDVDGCDITDADSVAAFFEQHRDAEVVLNAAAYTAVDDAENHPRKAMEVNGLGPGFLAAAARTHQMKMVHISTDFVFGNGHTEPIDEMERPHPLSVYGRTKLAGERLALQNNPATAVIRTSGLYSQWGGNFVETIARYAREGKKLKVIDDQYVSPTPVRPVAQVALKLSKNSHFVGGIYHATAQGKCSWYEFASAIVDVLGFDAAIDATTAEEWGAPAQRPEYSVLDNQRLRVMSLDSFTHWREHLKTFLDEHKSRYNDRSK